MTHAVALAAATLAVAVMASQRLATAREEGGGNDDI